MATYNGSTYIIEQLTSVLNQLGENDEIIISDDGSTDDTLIKITSFKDVRIKIFHADFKHPAQNFGNAISKAKGDYIFLCDQDDVWFENKVSESLHLLEECDLFVSDCLIVDKQKCIVEKSMFEKLKSGPGILKNIKSNTYLGCCMCFHKRMLPILMPFPKHIPMHDIWIGFVGDLFFKPLFKKIALIHYRRHGNNTTSPGASKATLTQRIKYRLNLLRYIPLLLFRKIRQSAIS